MQNVGAFFGIFAFSWVTFAIGRRPAFAMFFMLAGGTTAMVFMLLNERSDIFWMIPMMGFFQLALFGGYAIYFPELFPTRLAKHRHKFLLQRGPNDLGRNAGFTRLPEWANGLWKSRRTVAVPLCGCDDVFLLRPWA